MARGEKVVTVSHPSERLPGRLSKRALEGSGPIARAFATLFFTVDVLMSVRWLRAVRFDGTIIFVRYLLGTAYLPPALAPYGYAFFRRLLPFPDIAFFIDIDPRVAHTRIQSRGHRGEMFETPYRLDQVRRVATRLAEEEWVRIDNSTEGEAPFAEVEKVLSERLTLRPEASPPS